MLKKINVIIRKGNMEYFCNKNTGTVGEAIYTRQYESTN